MSPAPHEPGELTGMVSVRVADQTFGVPVLQVQDVIVETAINTVPLAPAEVAGSLNLRGRIVTAIDLRRRLGAPPREAGTRFISVIVERRGELYALLADDVVDVLWLSPQTFEPAPVTLSPGWRALCDGLYRLDGDLLLALSVERVLSLDVTAHAA